MANNTYKEVEEALLSMCLRCPTCIDICEEEGVKEATFSEKKYGMIWYGTIPLYSENKPIDPLTVIEHLTHAYPTTALSEEIKRLYSSDTAINMIICREYAAIIVERSRLRELSNISQIICTNIGAGMTSEQVISSAESSLLNIDSNRVNTSIPVASSTCDALSSIASIINGQCMGISTGFVDVDSILQGLRPGQMIVLAARPGIGKTSLALNICQHVASTGNGVMLLSLEMTTNELLLRILASMTKISLKKIKDGYAPKNTMPMYEEAVEALNKLPIVIDDYASPTISHIRSNVRRQKKLYGIKLVIIDYLQLIHTTNPKVPREQQVAEISRGIKAMAKELELPVIVLAQLNRASEQENRLPKLSDLRESGAIEQDADVVMFIDKCQPHRRTDESPLNIVPRTLLVAKNRSGGTANIQLMFDRALTTFHNAV